ncbi:MAG TPA: MFS transporter [Caulobacteraceae bacterium]|jgi:SHS family lactate transporter-like MFS transporter|nr:MFS transporter [Caulobacteraceae bacterium]
MSVLADLKGLDRSQKSAVIASFLGWSLDAFDFFLMVFMFKAIAADFHTDVKAVALASVLTLAARPFGAFVFGLFADRYGRRPVLMVDILLYSVIEFASAFAPSLSVLLILRAVFGFAMGGEWGVGASLTMESVPPKLRGLVSGFLQEGYAFGYLIAAGVYALLFDLIGWRGMFMVGVIPALLVVLIRMHVKESPAFEAHRDAAPRRNPLMLWGAGLIALAVGVGPALLGPIGREDVAALFGGLGQWPALKAVVGALTPQELWIYFIDVPIGLVALFVLFRKQWKMALYAVLLMTAFNFFSHGTQDLYPTFLQVQLKLDTRTVGLITAIMNCGAILGGLAFGAWSERVGRKIAIITAAVLSLPIIWLWAYSHTLVTLALGAFAMQVMVQGAWGVIPVHLNELSPNLSRGLFPGFVYQLGNLLASGNAVIQARVAESRHDNYSFALAVIAGLFAVVIAILTVVGPERRGKAFVETADSRAEAG